MSSISSLIDMQFSSEGNVSTYEDETKDPTKKSDFSKIKEKENVKKSKESPEVSISDDHDRPICPAFTNEADPNGDSSIEIFTGGDFFAGEKVMELRQVQKRKNEMETPEKLEHQTTFSFSKWDQLKFELNSLSQSLKQSNIVLPPNPTKWETLKYAFSCPPHGKFGRFLTYFLLLMIFWGSLVYITHEMALPGGTLFSILTLTVTAKTAGILVTKIHLPPLLAMLIVGIIFRSVPYVDVIGNNIDVEWSYSLRSVALVVILTRAGLELDPAALKNYSLIVVCLALCPCLVEGTAVSVASHFLLGFPWVWGFLLGFVLSALSPAVVVPSLLNLSDQGYGVEKGIPTIVIAAASIDDVLSISGFGICLGSIFSEGSSSVWQGLKGPLGLFVGVGYGFIMGVILWLVPNRKEDNANIYRFLILFLAGIFSIFGSKGLSFDGAGAPGCLCVAFVAGYGWRKQGIIPNKTPVNDYFNFLWILFEPVLFGLIGTEIRVKDLHFETVGWGVVILVVGLIFRAAATFIALLFGNFSFKERIFVTLAWIPKATVQAAIGSIALDYARKLQDDANSTPVLLGVQVLTIAVLVILITAPIGAISIMLSGPKLLTKTD